MLNNLGSTLYRKAGQNGRIDLNEKQFQTLKKNWECIEKKMNEFINDSIIPISKTGNKKSEEVIFYI
jgi:hypothetical protein